jgi:hypothetical protein
VSAEPTEAQLRESIERATPEDTTIEAQPRHADWPRGSATTEAYDALAESVERAIKASERARADADRLQSHADRRMALGVTIGVAIGALIGLAIGMVVI